MLNGDAVPWRMTGESTVWSMGIPFPLSIDKETTFPPIQLTNYATSKREMSHGNTTTNQLVIDADVSFYSASPMRLEGFGLLKAELYYDVSGNNPDLSPAERLKLAGPPLRPLRRRGSWAAASSEPPGRVARHLARRDGLPQRRCAPRHARAAAAARAR